jgi:hypothetical protein
MEEKMLETYDRADEIKALIEKEKEILAKEEEVFEVKKAEVEAELKELEDQLKKVNDIRASLLEGVDKGLLARYERILENKDGLAVVPIVGENCGGCFLNLPPQTINEVAKKKEIILCEICSRIMYIESDVKGADVDTNDVNVKHDVGEKDLVQEDAVEQDDVEKEKEVLDNTVEENIIQQDTIQEDNVKNEAA